MHPALSDPAVHGSVAPRQPVSRVSTLELFFDLVFVFTITQVTRLVEHARGPLDFLRAFLVLAVVWWMYGGYAWLTSNVGTERTVYRLFMLCGMAGFHVSCAAALLCDAPNGGGGGHSHDSGAAGAQRPADDDDLHACDESWVVGVRSPADRL